MSEDNTVVNRVFRVDLSGAGDGAEQDVENANRLLSVLYQLLEDYGPLWYPPELQEELRAVVEARSRSTRPRI